MPILNQKNNLYFVVKKIVIINICCLLCGCMGTIGTRMYGNPFGKYPYQSMKNDGECIADSARKTKPGWFLVFLVSFPVDFVIDTILLPADLIAWPFGLEKKEPRF